MRGRSIREYGQRRHLGTGRGGPLSSPRSAWAPVRSSAPPTVDPLSTGDRACRNDVSDPQSPLRGWAAVPGNRHGGLSLRDGPYVLLEAVSNGGTRNRALSSSEPGPASGGKEDRRPKRGGRPTRSTPPRSEAHRGTSPRRRRGLPARRRHRNEPQTNLHRRGGGRGGREYGEAERPHEATAHMIAGTLVDDDSPLFSRTYRQTTERRRVTMRPSSVRCRSNTR